MKTAAKIIFVNALSITAAFAAPQPQALDTQERKFLMEAAQGGMAEVKLGQLASERAAAEDVRDFGRQMASDHAGANRQLKELAAKKGVEVPSSLASQHQQLYDRLAKLNGADFDKAYVQGMVQDHRKDVSEFKKQASAAKDPDVKQFANNTLPTLEEHLQAAETLEKSVKR